MAFSRQQVLNKSVLNMNEVVRDMVGLLEKLVGPAVTFDLHLHPRPWLTKGDRPQLEQVLMNLATNARDAMPEGGSITITTDNVSIPENGLTVRPPVSGQYVMVQARDTGVGIPEDIQAKIFDPFFTTKELGKGTGLGLATVFGVVRQSGGYVYVDSVPNEGATFTLYLPRTLEPRESFPDRRRRS